MRPFWGEGDVGLDEIVGGLTRRGWARRGKDGRLELTLQGAAALDEVSAKVHLVRDALTDGITAEEYSAVVDTLRRMADNLTKVGVAS
jgi:DNA-binding MarR family transcriptional regulator